MKKPLKITLIVLAALLVVLVAGVAILFPYFQNRGQMGDNVYYLYNENSGTLVIYGEGEMWDFHIPGMSCWTPSEEYHTSPFYRPGWKLQDMEYAPLKRVIILEGVTAITANAFYGCLDLEEIYIPASMERIMSYAIQECPNLRRMYFSGDQPWMSLSDSFCKTTETNIAGEADSLTNHHITVIHKPGTTGYGGYGWGGIEAILEQNFLSGWARALWPW